MSQPALSEGIRALEAELRIPLIRRRRSFQGLTPEGERVIGWARRILADRDALDVESKLLRDGLSGTLRMGVIPSAATTVAKLLADFCAAHPLTSVVIDSKLSSEEVVGRLTSFELDAGLCYSFDAPDLEQIHLYDENWSLLAPEGMLDDPPEKMTWKEAATFPLVPWTPPSMASPPWRRRSPPSASRPDSRSRPTRSRPSSPSSTPDDGPA